MFLKNKKKIEFRSLIDGMDEIMPVIKASDLKHDWVDAIRRDYAEYRKNPSYGTLRATHTAKCPGMFTLMRHGWVIRAWQDILIETNGDRNTFEWATPLDQKKMGMENDYVAFHPVESLSPYMDHWPENSLKVVIKIHSPWVAYIPKGYYLMEMPVVLADEDRFSAVPGVLDCDHGPAPMNQQLIWHVPQGRTLIKAGTPLAQYVLVPKDEVDLVVSKYDASITDTFKRQLVICNTFVSNYKNLTKHFKL